MCGHIQLVWLRQLNVLSLYIRLMYNVVMLLNFGCWLRPLHPAARIVP